MKKISIILLFIICFHSFAVSGEAFVSVTYNKDILVSDVKPYIENSRTLIPVRMSEQLGYTVEWNEKDRTVLLKKGVNEIELTIDSDISVVNGKNVKLDVPAKIKESRTFVPVRFIAENFGYNVSWDDKTKTVIIEDKKTDDIRITNIKTEKTSEEFLIKLTSDMQIKNVKTMVLDEPIRYVYDIQDAILIVPQNSISVNSEIIKSVRYSQFSNSPNVVRIVIELNKKSEVTSKYTDGFYTISITDGDVPTVKTLKLTEGEKTASVYLTTDIPLNYTSYKLSNPSRFIIELPDSDIAANDIKGSGEVIEKAVLSRKSGVTTLTIYLSGAVSSTKCYITKKDTSMVITVNKISDDKNEETVKLPQGIVSKDEFLIVIDPGHGGDEPGSLGKIDDKVVLYEKDINLKIGKRVYENLIKEGYNVIATRTEDTTISLIKRVEIANKSEADLFVSIHNNSFENNVANGTLTMYAYDTPKEGQTFSGKDVAKIIQPYLVKATGGFDRELMENSKIYVNAKTNMPAVLCECLFMSNPDDLKKLMDEEYAKKIADGITEGIIEAVSRMTK